MARHLILATTLLFAALIAACGAERLPSSALPASSTPTSGAQLAAATLVSARSAERELLAVAPPAQVTPTPANEKVRIWWPDELYPPEGDPAREVLEDQFDSFAQTYTTVELEVRRKRTTGLGGILPTLRTAAPVAPGALPDLTLMRRADMITAANEGLIVPLDDWVPEDVAGNNLLPGVRSLGEINGVLYGVPYTLNVTHSAYRPAAFSALPASFADVLNAGTPYLFPAGTTPVSCTVLLQYRAAGGRLVDESGAATLDREPLLEVLTYYAEGTVAGIFTPALVGYTRYDDYWNQFVTGDSNLVGVDTVTFLRRRSSVPSALPVSIPTPDGTPITALDGWMWVVTTHNPEHRQRANVALAWMMRIGGQSLFTEAFGVLPTQTRALRLWDDRGYADFAQDLLTTAVLIPESQRNSSAALSLQEAIIAVLEGEAPDEAAESVLARFE